jgi:hypothetical protein
MCNRLRNPTKKCSELITIGSQEPVSFTWL